MRKSRRSRKRQVAFALVAAIAAALTAVGARSMARRIKDRASKQTEP